MITQEFAKTMTRYNRWQNRSLVYVEWPFMCRLGSTF